MSKYKELSKELQKQIEDDLHNEGISSQRRILETILNYIKGENIAEKPFSKSALDLDEKWSEIKKHIKKT